MSNLKAVRQALFNELAALNEVAIAENQTKLDNVIHHAHAVKGVCDSIIDTAKVEHNFMRMMERRLPFTDFMTDEVGQQVHNANYYARLAAEKRERAVLKLSEGEGESDAE
jgi:hypothetical protein